MGQKDITEKLLVDYNDVFADIVNGLLFRGKSIIQPDDLMTAQPISQYKANDGKIHEQERDLAKYWSQAKLKIALFGLENQSAVDETMPFRVIGYDGASYRAQLLNSKKEITPVITLVLYFGTEKHWDKPKNIKGLMNIPDYLEPYVNDYKIHVFEIAWLSEEEISRFHSDFQVVARFFVNKRKNPDYMLTDPTEMKHVDEVLKLLTVLTADNRYLDVINVKGRRIASMCDVAERLEQKGKMEGRAEGKAEGKAEGERLMQLLSALAADNRQNELARLTSDSAYREQLYEEYHIPRGL